MARKSKSRPNASRGSTRVYRSSRGDGLRVRKTTSRNHIVSGTYLPTSQSGRLSQGPKGQGKFKAGKRRTEKSRAGRRGAPRGYGKR